MRSFIQYAILLIKLLQIVAICRLQTQCHRGPKVGPGPAQISGFVKSKIDGENAVVCSEKCVISKQKTRKGLHRNSNGFSGRN